MRAMIPAFACLAMAANVFCQTNDGAATKAALAAAAQGHAEVYLAARTDGQSGTGAVSDPFSASTQERFDALFKAFGSNMSIHLGPGTYHTRGCAAFEVKPYWKIHGAGLGITKIIQDLTGQIRCTVFAGRADGVEIEDLSVDCGFQNQQVVNGKIKANAAAIGIGGSHVAVRRCWFNNYGSPYDAETGENFAVFIGSPDPDCGENLIVEDCIFAGMTPLLHSGQSVLTVAGGPPRSDLRAGNWARGCIARRNHFTGFHYGCHGITVDGAQGAMIVDNVFEHFMGACIYQDTWPMRDMIIANNTMSDVNQGIRLSAGDQPLNNFQIRDNILLMNDGYDIDHVAGGVVTTAIDHSLVVGNKVKFHKVAVTAGKGLTSDAAYVTSVPSRSTFTYSLTAGGPNETVDAGTGGFIQALDYQGCMCPAPEAIVIFIGGDKNPYQPTNFTIDRNIIKPYSSDDTARVPSVGIAVSGLKHSQITNNVIFDAGARDNGAQGFENLTGKVKPEPGQHADLVVSSPKGVTSTVICRDNRHPDGTRLSPRDNTLQIIEGGLMDLPLEAGRNVTLTPDGGKIRIDVAAGAKTEGMGLTHCVDPADPAKDSRFAGRPGDYAVGSGYMYVYTGDGKAHRWRRMSLDDY